MRALRLRQVNWEVGRFGEQQADECIAETGGGLTDGLIERGVPTRFANVAGSKATSLGLFTTGATYRFVGSAQGVPYTSVGLRLVGKSGRFNDGALARGIVAHGAPYVTTRNAGRSEGCPTMDLARARTSLPKLAGGSVVLLFSPNDRAWLAEDPWLYGSA